MHTYYRQKTLRTYPAMPVLALARPPVFPIISAAMGDLLWYVAHTRPRCEKKLAEYCERQGFKVTLPLYRSVKKYDRKTVVFEKPLFPNYVFLQLEPPQ